MIHDEDYDPRAWFWIVAGDDSRAWSSAGCTYVGEWPAGQVTRILNEQELRDVLAAAGLPDRSPLPVVPAVISDRQFAHALWKNGLISFEEALDFVKTGTMPTAIAAGLSSIPDEAVRQDTELLVSGAVEYRRDNPAVAALAGVLGWSQAQIDALWTQGASL